MMKLYNKLYRSPIGMIEIQGTDEQITSILFIEESEADGCGGECPGVLNECAMQLDEYFRGKRRTFTFPYQLDGTIFQKKVWEALTGISYGDTSTYKEIAVTIGNEKAVRGVGSSNGRNRMSIVVPCHRIIGSNGKLTGYAGGLWRKEWLLRHERSFKDRK
ncbi:methylated-DNA--[protein]-cysteine S-methyltransferase [Rossellomorea aquimaris]|uniref:Methylated-DNA--protein-cysteine methyltransferase n=1 Tax=Rossellomorea aquimaris TaxID=189382 RepID=A0A1J6WE67_9BACI|nr:methylated-DNA--[protein]-cysteine S-methyltransferase [Rossellomorea aquimaris]OIU66327.1 cysteine methyltransferase [Rossellomorea aquimaris]